MSLVRSILLCAGRGERLRPLTDRTPKPALPVLDVPLAAWGLSALATVGGTVVNAGHLGTEVIDALRPFGTFDVLREEPEPFGTAGTVAALADRIAPRLVTYNGDLLTDLDVDELVETHERSGCEATLAVQRVPSAADLVDDGAHVTRFIDRRANDAEGSRFLGIAVWNREALAHLPDRRPAGLGETLLPALAERGRLAVHVHHGYALDVGTHARYRQANLDALAGKAPPPPVEPPGRFEGTSYLGPGARADDAAGSVMLAGSSAGRVRDSVVVTGEQVPAGVELIDALWGCGRKL